MKLFKNMSQQSKLWIYQSDRALSCDEIEKIIQASKFFLRTWLAHGKGLFAKIEFIYDLFLMFAVDETKAIASGCSIDASIKFIKELELSIGVNFLNRNLIGYREGEEIKLVSRAEFRSYVEKGKITKNSIVFNNLIYSVEELTSWEVSAFKSWHHKAFFSKTVL